VPAVVAVQITNNELAGIVLKRPRLQAQRRYFHHAVSPRQFAERRRCARRNLLRRIELLSPQRQGLVVIHVRGRYERTIVLGVAHLKLSRLFIR
jgi:hypothetical protein